MKATLSYSLEGAAERSAAPFEVICKTLFAEASSPCL